ncbi:hypothetical protein ACJX0J_026717 [Zea mays]
MPLHSVPVDKKMPSHKHHFYQYCSETAKKCECCHLHVVPLIRSLYTTPGQTKIPFGKSEALHYEKVLERKCVVHDTILPRLSVKYFEVVAQVVLEIYEPQSWWKRNSINYFVISSCFLV